MAKASFYDPRLLFERRQALGMTQSDLAFHLGCSRWSVVRWEKTGMIKDRHLKRLFRFAANRPAAAPMVDVYKRHTNFTRYPSITNS